MKNEGGYGSVKDRQNNNFLTHIQNALAANPNQNTAGERHAMGLNKQNLSFTIPIPSSNKNDHKESWFGTRKSTENIFAGMKPSFSMNNNDN